MTASFSSQAEGGDAPDGHAYLQAIQGPLGRALSRLDAEASSVSRGSFDRTWWGWKFTDFSASRFQEGVFTLAWLATSPHAPTAAQGNAQLLDQAGAAIRFWARLQHADGSFDEAYPFERSLAATAFTGFYIGCGLERLCSRLPAADLDIGLRAIARGADWLARHGEYHGILSNHLAAAAAALQLASDLLGTDRYRAARDRYLRIIYDHQDPEEGWLREYGGADPGYQSHGMFYLAEIWRRTKNGILLQSLDSATEFIAWFAHPDGTLGGEYASRGTKFAYPAAFEILAGAVPRAGAVARHLRHSIAHGRGVGPQQVDSWNLFPVLNNYLFAADAAGDLSEAPHLPWKPAGAECLFERAGLLISHRGENLLAAGLSLGGAVKLWNAETARLVYQDCGFLLHAKAALSSQSASTWTVAHRGADEIKLSVNTPFTAVPRLRFDPWRFVAFRLFMLTVGRFHAVARGLKKLMVTLLIRRKNPHPARLDRTITFDSKGHLRIADALDGLDGPVIPIERQVPFHMGSARYADLQDWVGATTTCPQPKQSGTTAERKVDIIE